MKTIRIRKGHTPNMVGAPSGEVQTLDPPATLAVLPEQIPFAKPKPSVAEGDRVKVGSLLYVDKRNPVFKFRSPAGGTVRAIEYGPRRAIRQIVVERDEEEEFEAFSALDEEGLSRIDRSELVARLADGGLWPLIRELPFRDIASPDALPPSIIVSLDSLEPFHPDPRIYLNGRIDLFRYGLAVLHRLAAEGPVMVVGRPDTARRFSNFVSHQVSGAYPADDPGVVLYHTKKEAGQNRSWYLGGADVLLLAHLLKTGRYPTERVVVVAGSGAVRRRHCLARLGAPLRQLCGDHPQKRRNRYVVGGIFTGYTGSSESHLGLYETSLTLLPAGDEDEFLALFRPGPQKPTFSRLFLSRINTEPLIYDCNRRGGRRACIGCMHCADVCPVDILPQMTYKAILAEEVEEYLEHGLLDCVQCGLCSYVCPSKIELTETLKNAKAAYAREQKA